MTPEVAQEESRMYPGRLFDSAAALRRGRLLLFAIKDSDVRLLTLEQCRYAVDKGLHAGGAFSATIPLVSLYYGGYIEADVADPTRVGQDLFVLSKGHAVAALASIYAELGYFPPTLLRNSRSYESILNGHPGPLLPGVHVATGPMGQGLAVAQGFAIAGKNSPHFDCYAVTGDGELQEGPIWEAVMYAGQKRLDNLCVLVDRNNGQLDIHDRMVFQMPDLEGVFRSFGWEAQTVDATQYGPVCEALDRFKFGPRNGKPTAIICNTTKGHGGFSDFFNRHKVAAGDGVLLHEIAQHEGERARRVEEFRRFLRTLGPVAEDARVKTALLNLARQMHLDSERLDEEAQPLPSTAGPVLTRRVPPRDKRVPYDAALLPRLDAARQYGAAEVITASMKIFARHPLVVSVDSDLASTSGLEAGVAAVDQRRALNVGVAEANMMGIGEAFAAVGYNAWISTFCPFFDWKVMRRIAVGQQERLEAMEARDGWLSEGHGLDLTLLATAANFETRTNGATHMANDDVTIFDGMAHLKIIDVSCPQQLLAIMRWIMEGNRGMVYLRVMRTPSAVLYGADYRFDFGVGQVLRETPEDRAVIVSSGRQVHEALAAVPECARLGVPTGVVDMPSIDEDLLLTLHDSGKLLCIAEQNNGYILQNLLRILARHKRPYEGILAVNTLDTQGRPRFIHSGTYEELVPAFRLAPTQLAAAIADACEGH
ncbi:MAG TPA: transketolase C-terminal domain-containing protein [Candidatus Limnocylindrales bacterium]|nr:transketolase C-terminal domain-containing protein [Candidatus Limnocylindrales bacterium]